MNAALSPANLCLAVQLSNSEASNGLVLPAVAVVYFGKAGAVLVVIICFMAVTSSGAGEGLACTSLFTFDVYRRYLKPKVGACCDAVFMSRDATYDSITITAACCHNMTSLHITFTAEPLFEGHGMPLGRRSIQGLPSTMPHGIAETPHGTRFSFISSFSNLLPCRLQARSCWQCPAWE